MHTLLIGYNFMRPEKPHSEATKKQNSHIISQNSLTRLCGQTPP